MIQAELEHDPWSTSWLMSNYGAFITTAQLAKLFGFSNGAAVRQAYATGRLGIPLFRIEGRRGLFADAEAVGQYLKAQKAAATHARVVP